jgi:hypothetical protein
VRRAFVGYIHHDMLGEMLQRTESIPIAIPGKRENLFVIAYKFFPKNFLLKGIGLTFTTSLYIYNYLPEHGVTDVVSRIALTAGIIAVVPVVSLYLFTLARAPQIRKREEKEALHREHIAHGDLQALQVKEQSEADEVIRLEEVASGDRKARRVKDKQEDDRWELLNESLRLQNETVELASEERLLVAQQIKEIKEKGEVLRKGLISDDREARHAKELKEDERWDQLQEGEIMRKGLVSDDLEARHIKERREEKRWVALDERLRVQEQLNADRDTRQRTREEENINRRREDDARYKYRILFERYIRNFLDTPLGKDVANGMAPIPEEWLLAQPELVKDPELLTMLRTHNER